MQLVRQIVQAEGVAGLYRGFGASVATFVPSSAVWWGAYGAYQKAVWHLVYGDSGSMGSSSASSSMASNQGQQEQQQRLQSTVSIPQSAHQGSPSSKPSTSAIMAVQTTSSVMAGCTSALVTTPLDLIKTRIQIAYRSDGPSPTFSSVLKQILREEGPRGLLRGATPRMLNASLWGTCMVTVYEFLKRICTMDAEGVGAAAGLQTTAATPLLRGA